MSRGVTAPFGAILDRVGGRIDPVGPVTENRVSGMAGLYEDEDAWRGLQGDLLVYAVVAAPVAEEAGEVPFSITTIQPGTVGDEFFMTKGHAHTAREGEVYIGLSGKGLLLLYDGQEVSWVEISPDAVGYIPPGWAHRTVNVGEEPFRFLAVYPGDAGHDYGFVKERGMGARVYRDGQGYRIDKHEEA